MSDAIRSIPVNTVPPYAVSIGPGLLSRCGERLREVLPPCHAAVITDSAVAPLYLHAVSQSLRQAGFAVSTFTFPAARPK